MSSHFMRPQLTRGRGMLLAGFVELILLLFALAARVAGAADGSPDEVKTSADTANELTMVVMDPLALPLSCPCVQGYAQRDYDKLAETLQKELGRKVRVVYNESLTMALKGDAKGHADLVIGKHSVVLFDAKRSGVKLSPVARLTGKDGATTMTGLVVVPTGDAARSVSDLKGYRIVFGPEECDEKYAAAVALLRQNGVTPPAAMETSAACSDGACQVLDDVKKDSSKHGAALISSYAKPLLEGCGTVEKGSLRVVGETVPVPFIEAFVSEQLSDADRAALSKAVLKSTADAALCLALETRDGFVAIAGDANSSPEPSEPAASITDAKKK